MIKEDMYSRDFGEYMHKETRKQKVWDVIQQVVYGVFAAAIAYAFLVGYMAAFAD